MLRVRDGRMDQQNAMQPVGFIRCLLHTLYETNDLQAVACMLTPDATVQAGLPHPGKPSLAAEGWLAALLPALQPCRLEGELYQAIPLGEDVCLCTGFFILSPVPALESGRQQEVSALCVSRAGKWYCRHLQLSQAPPARELETAAGAFYGQRPAPYAKEMAHAQEIFQELVQKNHQMQVVLNAIQGGIKISRDDETYSYVFVSDELCAMFGYTHDEFMAVTGGSAVGAVYPPDLPHALTECAKAFENGGMEYTVKYRIPCKDGTLKWIIDSGKKVRNETGEVIINSIYIDVTEMENANLKIAGQKRLLDSIYNSIMCGILRYHIQDGAFTFITLNHEAMRILGYESRSQCQELGSQVFYDRIYQADRARVVSLIQSLQTPGERFSSEYRIQKSPEDPITWVSGTTELLDAGGQKVIQRIMFDITEKKKLELALDEERQRFRIAIESTSAVIFEYDILSDVYSAYGTLEKNGSKHEMERTIPHFLLRHLHEIVDESFRQPFSALLRGQLGKEMEARMPLYFGCKDFVWARITVTPICSEDGRFTKVIGKISNIQSEKEKEFALTKAKMHDGLTGLYTKEAGIRLIRDFMEAKSPDISCALMLLDMDNFKHLNTTQGRTFGDAVLQEAARIVLHETGKEDIQVRLGGDEFMILVKHCGRERAKQVGSRIVQLISDIFDGGKSGTKISASIGMCSTIVTDEYSGLYRCAESTLKYLKETSKGKAACFLDESNECGTVLTQLYAEKHTINEIDGPTARQDEDLISFALELLGKAHNLEDAIFLLLSRIGKSWQLDRVSVLELDSEFLIGRLPYQWSKKREDLQMGREFYISREEFNAICQGYDADGLCERRLETGGLSMPSCLHAAVFNHGIYHGCLYLETREPHIIWGMEQRKQCKELTKVIFSFLMKAHADAVSQAKTDFLSRMSHEIRTPMNAITGMTVIAKSAVDDREKTLDCLEKIGTASGYLLNLINDILDMSRIESGKMELHLIPMDLQQQLTNVEVLIRPQAQKKGIRLTVENLYTENRRLMADSLRLEQILVNITGNAVKFTAPGGCVLVRAEPVAQDEGHVSLRFSVRDNGIGISPQALGRIFHAFEQAEKNTAAQYGGTGLGLSISSRLVQLMDSTIEVESTQGKGSRFWFTIRFQYAPAEEARAEAEKPQAKAEAPAAGFEGKRILLAEDNALNREIAQAILEMNGFDVETAEDGLEAVRLFTQGKPFTYDVVLLDIRMPRMDGLEACRCIRTAGKPDSRSVPIIAMTANAFTEDTEKSMASGMNGHLSKPIQVEVLLATLRRCLWGAGSSKEGAGTP